MKRKIEHAYLAFGDVCPGWTPAAWAVELCRKADRCEQDHADMAAEYRAWAAQIESRLSLTFDETKGMLQA